MPDEIDILKKQLEAEKKKVSVLEQRLSAFEVPGAIGLYYGLERFINGVNDLMRKYTLESLLNGTDKEDPKRFEKMMSLIKNAKEHVSDMMDMKEKIGITGDEIKDKAKKTSFLDSHAK